MRLPQLRTLHLRLCAIRRRLFGADARELTINGTPPFIHLDKPLAHTRLRPARQQQIIDLSAGTSRHRQQRHEVRQQLVTELEAGVAAGTSHSHPINSRAGCRTLRRHHRRRFWQQRSRLSKYISRSARAASWICLASIPLSMALFFFSNPQLTVNYLDQLNQNARALAEEERAWPLYRDVLLALPPIEADGFSLFHHGFTPEDPMWSETAAYLKDNADLLERVREGTARKGLGFIFTYLDETTGDNARALKIDPLDSNQPPRTWSQPEHSLTWNLDLSIVGAIRKLGRLLIADTRAAIEHADAARVANNIRAILRLADQTNESQHRLTVYTSVALRVGAMGLAHEAFHNKHPSFQTPAFLDSIATALPGPAADLINPDRLLIEVDDWIQRSYMPHRIGPELYTPNGLLLLHDASRSKDGRPQTTFSRATASIMAPIVWAVLPTRRSLEQKSAWIKQTLEHERHVPLWQQARSRVGDPFHRPSVVPSLDLNLMVTWQIDRRTVLLSDTFRDGLRINLALHHHRHDHGTWPENLQSLVPQYLNTLPLDPADGQPLRYLLRNNQPVIYSLGADADDDQGHWPMVESSFFPPRSAHENHQPPEKKEANLRATQFGYDEPVDGDWVLYPPPTAN